VRQIRIKRSSEVWSAFGDNFLNCHVGNPAIEGLSWDIDGRQKNATETGSGT
jgi:hypothetical protein